MNVVDRRLEDAAQPKPVSSFTLDLVEDLPSQRPDNRLELAVARCHPYGDVSRVGIGAHEDGVERKLEILEVLDRQVQANREPAENKVRDTVELGLARQRERDLVS